MATLAGVEVKGGTADGEAGDGDIVGVTTTGELLTEGGGGVMPTDGTTNGAGVGSKTGGGVGVKTTSLACMNALGCEMGGNTS